MAPLPASGLEQLLEQILLLFLFACGLALFLSLLLGLLAVRSLRRLEIADGASLLETLRATPLTLVVALDLLDFGLDVLAAPITWLLLRRLRLQALRDVAVFEALLPGTQVLPLMTLAWILARNAPDAAIWRWPGASASNPKPKLEEREIPAARLDDHRNKEMDHDEH